MKRSKLIFAAFLLAALILGWFSYYRHDSVEREDYENAAKIRDNIRLLEKQLVTEGAEPHE